MKYCEKCKVTVRGAETFCPLCRHRLTGTAEEPPYPTIPTVYKQNQRIFKLLGLLTVLSAAVCAFINLLIPQSGFWSAFVLLGIICFWVSLAYALRKQNDIPKTMTGQVIVLSILCVLWDYFTGWHGWSLEFVFPITCITAMVSLAILAKILKMPIGDYFIYLFANIAFGIIPLIFLETGLLRVILPSEICMLCSFVSFLFLMVSEGRAMLSEISRRFHV